MNKQIDYNFTLKSFSTPTALNMYSEQLMKIGLWNSEKAFFVKHLHKNSKILDIGCGAGRVTFELYKLGYKFIQGLDITPEMINKARLFANKLNLSIPFDVGDACDMSFEDGCFESCVFSFNGLMQIPKHENRSKAFNEISRILKPNGIFVFTTHDREFGSEYMQFWQEEKAKWENGLQDKRLHDFGDVITNIDSRELFMHVPDKKEILESIRQCGLELIEDIYQTALAEESDELMKIIKPCRFWAVRKP